MATEVLINFLTKNLDKAKQTAKDIAAKVKEARKAIADPVVRKAFVARQKEIAKGVQQDIKNEQARIGLEARAGKLRGRDFDAVGGRAGVLKAKEGLEKIRSLGGAVSSGNLAGLLTLAGAAPIIGPVAIAASVAAFVMKELDKREAFRRAAQDQLIKDRVAAELAQFDFAKRIEEDVQFRDRQERRASALFVRTEIARGVGGWHPRSGGLIEVG